MRGRGVRLSEHHERWTYWVLAFVFLTGAAWIALHYGPADNGPEGAWRPAETWVLRLHGAAAMAALVAFGSLLAQHVPSAWRLRRHVASGVALLSWAAVLAATGWLLYYASGEGLREWSGYAHMALGIAGPLGLAWHLAHARRRARTAAHSMLQSRAGAR